MQERGGILWAALVAVSLCGAGTLLAGFAGPARADSTLRLHYPTAFGSVPASTFTEEGKRLGSAQLVVEKLDDGNVRILQESGIDGGARTVATALLEPTADGQWLRPLRQESRSFLADGTPLGVLSIDHRRNEARCAGQNGNPDSLQVVPLPDHDRVANVPLSLLFEPLVSGERHEISFQLFLCRGEPRFVDFEAHVEDTSQDTVEVRYGPDLGVIPSWLVHAVIPKLSVWFDQRAGGRWLAARLPLYSKGPEVVVIRSGVAATPLTLTH